MREMIIAAMMAGMLSGGGELPRMPSPVAPIIGHFQSNASNAPYVGSARFGW